VRADADRAQLPHLQDRGGCADRKPTPRGWAITPAAHTAVGISLTTSGSCDACQAIDAAADVSDLANARLLLARNLRRARERGNDGRGFSQTEVARRLGVTRQSINRWEREKDASGPREVELVAAAKLYGTTVQELRYSTDGASELSVVPAGSSDEERIWLAEFQLEILKDFRANPDEVRWALALVGSAETLRFYMTGQPDEAITPARSLAAMEVLAGAIRQELGRRRR
jgi:transcriptional regulator with XRE-family HTH domain